MGDKPSMNLTGRPVTPKGGKCKRSNKPLATDDPLILVAMALGTDKEFREWLQRQPSVLTGHYSEYTDQGKRNPACHVRRANRFGIAFKAPYACVPMTHEEHAYQHRWGEARVIRQILGLNLTREEAAAWFDAKARETLARWVGEKKVARGGE